MAIAFRMTDPKTGQDYSFDPGRDIAYFWPQLVRLLLDGCREGNWEPWYAELLREHQITEETLLATTLAFVKAHELAASPTLSTPMAALTATGFLTKPLIAQFVVIAKLGQLGFGAFWAGIRHSHMQGVVPESIKMIQEEAKQTAASLSKHWHEKIE